MSYLAPLAARRVSPNKGVDLAVPKLIYIDPAAQIGRVLPNVKRGGAVIKYVDSSRRSQKVEVYETPDQVLIAFDPNTTNNPYAVDLNLAVAGTGTTQGGGTALVAYLNKVTTLTAGSAEALTLPTAAVGGKPIVVINAHATAAAKVFPPTGAQINALGANAVFSMPPGTRQTFVPTALLQYMTAQ